MHCAPKPSTYLATPKSVSWLLSVAPVAACRRPCRRPCPCLCPSLYNRPILHASFKLAKYATTPAKTEENVRSSERAAACLNRHCWTGTPREALVLVIRQPAITGDAFQENTHTRVQSNRSTSTTESCKEENGVQTNLEGVNNDVVDLAEQARDGLPAAGGLQKEAEVAYVPLAAVPAPQIQQEAFATERAFFISRILCGFVRPHRSVQKGSRNQYYRITCPRPTDVCTTGLLRSRGANAEQ